MNYEFGYTTVCGFKISRGGVDEHVNMIKSMCKKKLGAWIVTLNTEMLSNLSSDTNYEKLIRSADFFLADGMPIVWVANKKSPANKIYERTTGVDLVERLIKSSSVPPFAIIGGTNPGSIISQYPNAEEQCRFIFTGAVDLSEQKIEKLAKNLKESDISLLLLALGVPKQDKIAKIFRQRLPNLVIIGIGGTFDILSSSGGRAPFWMQNSGLEWLYRLYAEPTRLWRRYILKYPYGITLLLKDCFAKR